MLPLFITFQFLHVPYNTFFKLEYSHFQINFVKTLAKSCFSDVWDLNKINKYLTNFSTYFQHLERPVVLVDLEDLADLVVQVEQVDPEDPEDQMDLED